MVRKISKSTHQRGEIVESDLRRYTDIPSLLHILKHAQLTLLDPSSWDDKNDAFYLALYREKFRLTGLLALCFTRAPETYHHWRVFAPGPAGICIQFDSNKIRAAVKKTPGAQIEPVTYMTLPTLRATRLQNKRLPFVKRFAFAPENEVRVIWESTSDPQQPVAVPISLSSIKRITLSPWLHRTLGEEVRSIIRGLDGCDGLKISLSKLISNDEWMARGRDAR